MPSPSKQPHQTKKLAPLGRVFSYAIFGLLFVTVPFYSAHTVPLAVGLVVALSLSAWQGDLRSPNLERLNIALLSFLFLCMGARLMAPSPYSMLAIFIAFGLWLPALFLWKINTALSHKLYFGLYTFHTTRIGAIIVATMIGAVPHIVRLTRETSGHQPVAHTAVGLLFLLSSLAAAQTLSHGLWLREQEQR